MTKSELHSALLAGTDIERQIELEQEYRDSGVFYYTRDRERSERKGDAAMLKPGEAILRHWFGPLTASIDLASQEIIKTGAGPGGAMLAAPLKLLRPELMATLTIREVLGAMLSDRAASGGVKLTAICYAVGRALFAEINFDTINKTEPGVAWILNERVKRLDPSKIQWWANRSLEDPANERRVAIALGAMLVDHLVNCAYSGTHGQSDMAFVIRNIPAGGKRRCRVLSMHNDVYAIIEDGHYRRQILRPSFGPMVVKPYPWSSELEGGFVKLRTPLISKITRSQREAMKQPGTELVYEALNSVSGVPLSVNTRVLDVAAKLWERGGNRLGMPPKEPTPLPPMPERYRPGYPTGAERWAAVSKEDKKAWKAAASDVFRLERDLRGQRTETASILDLATRHSSEPAIYFPHQLDFRGRMYPIPVHLNDQNSDLCRGLLQFSRRVPLGNDGMYWLCVHAANCYGIDKIPFDDRVEWVKQNATDIARSVSDPLGSEFWMSAEDPFQFLAACYALDDDTAGQMLPVHFDGSNNGLQWFSAMTRDEIGGSLVNLIPGDRPADGYTDVCNEARESVRLDQVSSEPVLRRISLLAEEHLVRKLVKRPVMVQPYGVTKFGARGQIRGQLKDAGVSEEDARPLSAYLSKKIVEGIGDKFPGASAAMWWLKKCASNIAKSGEFVRWTSPLGVPVIQDGFKYRDQSRSNSYVQTTLGRIRVSDEEAPVKTTKSVQGLAPNFVHSVDSSHMGMSAIMFAEHGMDFKARHDSFGMHAGVAGQGRAIVNEQFVLLAKSDPLAALRSEFIETYPGVEFPELPEYGNLDLDAISESEYLFG